MRISLIILFSIITCGIKAQNYTRDCGLRFGETFSVSYRQFFDEGEAMSAMVSVGRRGLSFTVLKEYAQPAFGHFADNITFVYGFGAHAGFRYSDQYIIFNRTYKMDDYRFMPQFGIDGYLALEYAFHEFPFIMGVDFKPYFEYSNIEIFRINLSGFGLNIKYRF